MGVWGVGNFDYDYSRDFLADMVGKWEDQVDKLLAGEIPEVLACSSIQPGLDTCEACVISIIEVMITVADRLIPDYLPEQATVDKWRSQYLHLFDCDCQIWNASPEHLAKRRDTIEATFERLTQVIVSRKASKAGARNFAKE